MGKLLQWGSSFLASKGVTVGLLVLVGSLIAGGVVYYTHQAEERGRLEAQLKTANADNQAWAKRFDQLQQDRELFARFDQQLEDARRDRQRQAAEFYDTLEDLQRERPDVEAYRSTRAPEPYARLLCEYGVIDPAGCPEDPGTVPDRRGEGASKGDGDG